MNFTLSFTAATLLIAASTNSANAQPSGLTVAGNWSQTLRADAKAFHDLVQANHPGPFNKLDPLFTRRNDQALSLALQRADRVSTFAGYLWAMRGYVASFDDGHVQFSTLKGSPLLKAQWPGFLTGSDPASGHQIVMTREADAPVPIGARLLSCDGKEAASVLASNVGAFSGRWNLAAQRFSRAGRLFVDTGNPFIRRPSACRFVVAGKTKTISLRWRSLEEPDWTTRVNATAPSSQLAFGVRTLADGTFWFAMPSFDSDPEGLAGKALRSMIEGVKQNRSALLAAPRILFDLRGNGGGSSQWSADLANALWGPGASDAADQERTYVEWRASDDNIATIKKYRDLWKASPDASPDALRWAQASLLGLEQSRKAGRSLWREPEDPTSSANSAKRAPTKLAMPVYVLTDWRCASACLDAVDLWTSLGAIVVGRETSADTNYMEVGDAVLPSGLASVGIPMKVYRGRKRGSNEPVTPTHRFAGDMSDTAALETWITTLRP